MYYVKKLIFILINIILTATYANETTCSHEQLNRIKKISQFLNAERQGLDFEQDREDIKLHIAHKISRGRSCLWSNEIEEWFNNEMLIMEKVAEFRINRNLKMQERTRKRINESTMKKLQPQLGRYYYSGIKLNIIEEMDLTSLGSQEKQDYLNKLKTWLSGTKLKIQVDHRSSSLIMLINQQLVLGFYQIDYDLNGKPQTEYVRVRRDEIENLNEIMTESINPKVEIDFLKFNFSHLVSRNTPPQIPQLNVEPIIIKRDIFDRSRIFKINQRVGLPFDKILKYKKIIFFVDFSYSMYDYFKEWNAFIHSFELLAKELNLNIEIRAILESCQVLSFKSKISHLSYDGVRSQFAFKLGQCGALLGAALDNSVLPKDKDTLLVFLGDGQDFDKYTNQKELITISKVMSPVIYKPFGKYNLKYFEAVKREKDRLLGVGLKVITNEDISYLKEFSNRND